MLLASMNHICRARWLIFALRAAIPENVESATAVHVVTIEPVEEGLELNPSKRRPPPDVQLWRTLLGDIRE